MHGGVDIVVPVLSDGTLAADLAVDGVALNQRKTSNDARLPLSLTVVAVESTFVDLSAAVLASPSWKAATDGAIHVDFEHPVSDLISLFRGDNVLLWEGDLKWRWDISLFELCVFDAASVIRIINGIIKIDISIKENEGRVMQTSCSVCISCIKISFVSPDLLGVSEETSA